MKFARRAAPSGRPSLEAHVAAILDGRTLWLAVPARGGALGLRSTTAGTVVDLPIEDRDDQPGLLSTRFDLAALSGTEDAAYDVVLDGVPVRSAPLERPAARPGADDSHVLHRTPDGTLQVRRGPVTPAATLRRLQLRPDGIRITVDGGGPTLALLADDDTVLTTYELASYELDEGPAPRSATITAASLVGLLPQATRVVVGQPGAWVPVGRRDNHLADPGRGVPLPELSGAEQDGPDGPDTPRLRLRWSAQAQLQARVLEGHDATDGPP